MLGAVRESVIRRWLEVLLPLYTAGLVWVQLRPEYTPVVLTQGALDSAEAFVGWAVAGAMFGILMLWALIVAFFLAYSPAYLVTRLPRVLSRGWVDRRELTFYGLCFTLLCALVAVACWASFSTAVLSFVLIAGCGPILWRQFV
jgi:hypothetical protein